MSDWIGYLVIGIVGAVGAVVCMGFYVWGLYHGLESQIWGDPVGPVKEAIKRNKGGLRSIIQGLQPSKGKTP